jgi:hypothetical protein
MFFWRRRSVADWNAGALDCFAGFNWLGPGWPAYAVLQAASLSKDEGRRFAANGRHCPVCWLLKCGQYDAARRAQNEGEGGDVCV